MEGVKGQDWKFVSLRVEGDVHVDSITRRIGEITGFGMDADPRNGIIRIYVPPARADEAYIIADRVSREIGGLTFLGVGSRPSQVRETIWDKVKSLCGME
jgi:hypothetical protein